MGGDADYYYDGSGFFNYEEKLDWSSSAIYPQSCYSTDDGDYVVYALYGEGHNECNRKKIGTYKTTVDSFIRAYAVQQAKEAQMRETDYDASEVLQYLSCTAVEVNDSYYYYKLGCRDSTGKGFKVDVYTDPYCSQKANIYNNYVDTSALQVSFEYCKKCVYNMYNSYNYNGNNQNMNYYPYYMEENDNDFSRHQSPLCSAMYAYKEKCGYSCKKHSKKNGSSSFSTFGTYNEGYNYIEMGAMWVLTLSAIIFLLKGLSYRKKFSKRVQQEEIEAAKTAGISKENIVRAIIVTFIFISLMIVFRMKLVVWFSLVIVNILFLTYYCYLKSQKIEIEEDSQDYELYNNISNDSMEESKPVKQKQQVKKYYTIKKEYLNQW